MLQLEWKIDISPFSLVRAFADMHAASQYGSALSSNRLFLIWNYEIRYCAAIGRVLALFSRIMRPRSYVIDVGLGGICMLARTPSMLLDNIIVRGPNTYMGVSRACDASIAAPSSVIRPLFDPLISRARRYFLATKDMDQIPPRLLRPKHKIENL